MGLINDLSAISDFGKAVSKGLSRQDFFASSKSFFGLDDLPDRIVIEAPLTAIFLNDCDSLIGGVVLILAAGKQGTGAREEVRRGLPRRSLGEAGSIW